jgi:hypothetical protein
MTDKINDGGSAFTQLTEIGDIAYTQGGMSLRDWFAGHCIQASLGSSPLSNLNTYQAENYARFAYMVADAMLAARGGKP